MRLARAAAALASTLALVAGGLAGAGAIARAATASAATASAALPAAAGAVRYRHTSGNQILDSAGRPGPDRRDQLVRVRDPRRDRARPRAQDYHAIINDIKNLGYNTIRIPFSNQMVETPSCPRT